MFLIWICSHCSSIAAVDVPLCATFFVVAMHNYMCVMNASFNNLATICDHSLLALKRLQHLHLDYNNIHALESNCFQSLSALQVLTLVKNKLRRIPKEAFITLQQLRKLNLSRNRLRKIDWFSFKGLHKVQILHLERNALSLINDGAFGNLAQLLELYLNNNKLTSVGQTWLYGLEKLEKLVLSSNSVSMIESKGWRFCQRLLILDLSKNRLSALDSNIFSYLQRLEKLDLSENAISRIDEKALSSLGNLEFLDLSNNQLSDVFMSGQHIFLRLSKLKVLKLNNNKLRSLPSNVFRGLDQLTRLELLNNPIIIFAEDSIPRIETLEIIALNSSDVLCNCKSKWLISFFQKTTLIDEHLLMARCKYPPKHAGNLLMSIPLDQLTCDVYWPKPEILEQPQAIIGLQGATVTFNCSAVCTGGCNVLIYWSKNDQRLYSSIEEGISDRLENEGNRTWTSYLTIEAVDEPDSGFYRCHVINELTMTVSNHVSLTVQIPPFFTKRPENTVATVGGTIRLECAASGQPDPMIFWQKDGGHDFPAARERRFHVMPSDVVFFIVLAKYQDSGVYSCIANSSAGFAKAEARLTVLDRSALVMTSTDKTVDLGKTAVLQCDSREDKIADGRTVIQWSHNGQPFKLDKRRFIAGRGHMLVIVEARAGDQGIYTCELNGNARTLRLIVKELSNEASKKFHSKSKSDDDKDDEKKNDDNNNELSSTNVKSRRENGFDILSTAGIVIVVVVLCVVLTSFVWLCFIWRNRRPASVVVAIRPDPLELSAVSTDIGL
ncbi:Leucine-rich repeats and immunoglobulin-like domains protein 2 [Trichinella pseudospiralis]|uniref:Leucine-rich repeats and immunoglobulin-like domains protein 2 n=1 Tax=Trichinella pseudospiralis TaxID=6337 RepID=A0A0V1JF19_TRIPS|nr:Leucine-rich repeats and immunoglobulin-like domains protein 2 [Trichinella pseudospiralis]